MADKIFYWIYPYNFTNGERLSVREANLVDRYVLSALFLTFYTRSVNYYSVILFFCFGLSTSSPYKTLLKLKPLSISMRRFNLLALFEKEYTQSLYIIAHFRVKDTAFQCRILYCHIWNTKSHGKSIWLLVTLRNRLGRLHDQKLNKRCI